MASCAELQELGLASPDNSTFILDRDNRSKILKKRTNKTIYFPIKFILKAMKKVLLLLHVNSAHILCRQSCMLWPVASWFVAVIWPRSDPPWLGLRREQWQMHPGNMVWMAFRRSEECLSSFFLLLFFLYKGKVHFGDTFEACDLADFNQCVFCVFRFGKCVY